MHSDTSGAVLFEDDPYRDLCYENCDRTPICSMLSKSNWIYQSSFSKTIAPGLRLGYLTCSENLFTPLLQLKQAADLHSNRVSQRLIYSHLISKHSSQRLGNIITRYTEKRDQFQLLLEKHFSDLATWDIPKGGLFFWLKLNTKNAVNTQQLLAEAIEKSVAFMPGDPFYSDGRQNSKQIRLNFSHADYEQADRGLAVLAKLIRVHY